MLDASIVNSIVAPYDLEVTERGLKVKSVKFEFGTVNLETIYEMMFIHNLSRDAALLKISKLLNEAKTGLTAIIKADNLTEKVSKVKKTRKL